MDQLIKKTVLFIIPGQYEQQAKSTRMIKKYLNFIISMVRHYYAIVAQLNTLVTFGVMRRAETKTNDMSSSFNRCSYKAPQFFTI